MAVHVETFGFRELAAEMQRKAATIDQDTGKVNVSTARKIAAAMAVNVPRLTGATAASVSVRTEGNEAEASIGGAAIFLEFGTIHAAPRPFLEASITPTLAAHDAGMAEAADLD